eukprot:CAMPEP_0168393044 /NCGR_PEP_ID=MMETSP0228-20121227/18812_1 /TAXON_ID=133427 /ORGANISM="Protoceratium reticulatum, Strain CCCM 535 (=CCMP 1889)" /LENGTH=264 /DNA_ID=CAMNT_0008406407 /DNA_START=32 /DNA_END=823 /DNA_ORIENTATION=+
MAARMRVALHPTHWAGVGLGLSICTLRFHDTDQERGFLTFQRDKLLSGIFLLSVLLLCLASTFVGYRILFDGALRTVSFPSQTALLASQIQLISVGTTGVIGICLALLARRARKDLGLLKPASAERLVVLAFVVTMCCTVLGSLYNITSMLGHAPQAAWGDAYFSDSTSLLIIDGIITATHFVLPARWYVMVPLEVTGILLYLSMVSLIGSPEDSQMVNLECLVGLTVAAAIAKRSSEVRERRAFCELLRERSLRCEAEFKLSQ